MLNRLFALILLFIFFPIFLIVSIAIFIEDGFPILFIQKRVGVNYTFFNIYKFRSMKINTPNIATHKLSNPEQYLLKIGKFIRKTSLDELPNLINVIKGEMVFIGPRPALHNQYDLIQLREETGVSKLKPGISGWAQVNGRDELTIENKILFEIEYLNRKSLKFDFMILLKTIYNIISKKGVTH